MRITLHLLPEPMPQLQNPPTLSDPLNTLLHCSLLKTILMLWICLLLTVIQPPVEIVGNASVVAPKTTWSETAHYLIIALWESAQPIYHPVLTPLQAQNLHLCRNDTVPHLQTCQQKE